MKQNDPDLVLKYAETDVLLHAAQRLRYRVFVQELGANASEVEHQAQREIDKFDAVVSHLCLVDQRLEVSDPEDAVVGVYRLIDEHAAAQIGGFYSQGEFDISRILAQPGRKLELGRSCIDPAYRGGAAMAMLWSGLGAFAEENHIDYLFGSASFQGVDIAPKAASLSHLHHKYLAPVGIRAMVLPENGMDMNLVAPENITTLSAMRETPSLIKAYLRLGGTIGDGAFVDHNFNTVDVFVLMQTQKMVEKYKAMYRR